NNNLDGAGAAGTVNNTGNRGGSGRINGALVANGGTINPGAAGAAGILTVDGSYIQNASATLNIQLGGTAPTFFDTLSVGGTATLAGVVDVSFIGGFATGGTWDIVTAGGGLTSTAILSPEDAPYGWLSIVGNSLRLTIEDLPPPCTTICGDYNADGSINAADYTVYRNYLSGIIIGPPGTSMRNDPTPESVSYQDYVYWKLAYDGFFDGSGSTLGDFGSVLEPTSILLLGFAAMAVGLAVRRR
ncbi:MAG: PEP-CTERM sorting domain-containing protein, partial [Pirellulales bacterium]